MRNCCRRRWLFIYLCWRIRYFIAVVLTRMCRLGGTGDHQSYIQRQFLVHGLCCYKVMLRRIYDFDLSCRILNKNYHHPNFKILAVLYLEFFRNCHPSDLFGELQLLLPVIQEEQDEKMVDKRRHILIQQHQYNRGFNRKVLK